MLGEESDPGTLFPDSMLLANNWAPSGMDDLGPLLSKLCRDSDIDHSTSDAAGTRAGAGASGIGDAPILSAELKSFFRFQLGAWHAGRGDVDAALTALASSDDDRAHALRGRLLRFVKEDAAAAAASFANIGCAVTVRR